MHGEEKLVFLRSESSDLSCGNSLELGSLCVSVGSYLKMPSVTGLKPCNEEVMRFPCTMCGQCLVDKSLLNSGSLGTFTGCHAPVLFLAARHRNDEPTRKQLKQKPMVKREGRRTHFSGSVLP